MADKVAKKARLVLDPKEKEKYRFTALESILGKTWIIHKIII